MSFSLNAQIQCGAIADPLYLQELDQMISVTDGCEDDLTKYDLSQPITFNLVLNYAKDGTDIGAFDSDDRIWIENEINNVYNENKIYFNFIWNDLNCDDCLIHEDQWPEYMVTNTCIQGHVLSSYIPNSGDIGGYSNIGSGTFWAYPSAVAHELGHSIGLLHTHSNDASTTGYTDELMTRNIPTDINNNCSCNCLTLGDKICDTPPDPYISFPANSAEEQHNADIFDGCDLENDNQLEDGCGGVYADPNGIITNNVMSYHCNDQNKPRLTEGQNNFIRMTRDNEDGSFEFQSDPSEMPFIQGLTVNSSTTKDSDQAYNGDVIVNSTLRIENCTIELTEGHKIIVNPGAKLIVKNATIRTYTGGICYFPMDGKTEWEGIEIVLQDGSTSQVRFFDNSTIENSESGIYNPDGTEGRVHLAMIQSTINGPAINLTNNTGLFTLSSSYFDHTIHSKNNRSLSVNGCNFTFPNDSEEPGILAMNSRLVVKAGYYGNRNNFKNCGRAIDFISSSSQAVKISGTDFNEVLSGINAVSTAGSITINDCDIKLRSTGVNGFSNGILIDNFIDFGIYDNVITGSNSGAQNGIKIFNTDLNDNPNLIVNNTIKDCNNGIVTSDAELGNGISGIEFSCNTLTNIFNNHFSTIEIGPQQGRGANNPNPRVAGNKFDGTTECGQAVIDAGFCFSDFNYQGSGFSEADKKTYYYRDGVGNDEVPVHYNPGGQNTGVPLFLIEDLGNTVLPLCDYSGVVNNPNYPLPLPYPHSTYTNMFDGGNTGGDVTSIFNNSGSDPDGVINQILSNNSPWVSVPVVQAIFANSQNFTESQVAQVIIQNPGVLVDSYIEEVVFERGSFSLANQNLMLQAYQVGDARIDYQRSLLDVILYGTLTIKKAMGNELVNGTFDQSLIRSHLAVKISHTKLYQTVESYVLDNDYQNALSVLNSRMGGYTFDPAKVNEETAYADILTMGMLLYNQDLTWTKISNADKTRLINIANNYYGAATNKARNILSIYHDMNFGIMPTKPLYSPIVFGQIIPRFITESELIQVYPNPADGYLNINGINASCMFELISTDGRVVYSQLIDNSSQRIDISQLDSGIYFYQIKNADEIIHIDRLIILD